MSGSPLLARHAEALDLFSSHVHAIRDDQWDAPTPCTEWTVRDLVNHLTGEQLWVVPLVRDGSTIAEIGDAYDGDLLGQDPVATWDASEAAAREVLREPGALDRTVHLSYGDVPAAAYCAQMTADAVVHAWDLARGIGADDTIPEPLVDFALQEYGPHVEEFAGSGLFAPALPVPSEADAQTKLLALLGRAA